MSLRTRRGLAMWASIMLVAAACQTTPGASTAPTTAVVPTDAAPTGTAPGDSPEPSMDASPDGSPSASPEPSMDGSPSASPDGSPSASPDGSPQAGGQLVYAIDGEISQLTNALTDLPTAEAVGWMYNGLYRYDESLSPIPDLAAEEATVSEDGLTWTIQLRDDAVFQPTGTPLTAEDVVFTYQLSNSANCRFNPSICISGVRLDDPDVEDDPEDPTADDVPLLTSVEATGDLEVTFQLSQKYAPFVTTTLPGTLIDSKAAVEEAYAAFQSAAGQVTDADVTDLQTRIAAEQETPTGPPDPDGAATVNLVQFRAELESLLGSAGVEGLPQPDPELFPATDDEGNPTGEVDEVAYVDALNIVFQDFATSLDADGIDALAAAYPLLSISRAPVGTGPFYVTNFTPGQQIELARNEDYHFGAPQIETMFMPIIKDDIQGAEAVAAGEIDWKYSITAPALPAVQDQPNVKIAEYPDFGYFGLQFNLREGRLFADPNLRQALALCVQKDEIVQVATQGQAITIYSTIPPASWAYNPDVEKYPYDPAAGKALIEASGWTLDGTSEFRGDNTTVYQKDGKVLGTNVLVRADKPDRQDFMRLLADQANTNCGFDISTENADFSILSNMISNFPHTQPGLNKPFDAYFGGWGTGFDPDPYAIWHGSQCTTQDQPNTFNYICYQNDEADDLIDQGLLELDQDARAEIYQQFEALVAKDLPYLFAWSDIAREAINANLNSMDQAWTPEVMDTPTWFYEMEKITKTTN